LIHQIPRAVTVEEETECKKCLKLEAALKVKTKVFESTRDQHLANKK